MEQSLKKYLLLALVISIPLIAVQIWLNRTYRQTLDSMAESDKTGPIVMASSAAAKEQVPPPPSRFRVPSSSPAFGKPLDYSFAVSGDLKLPGSTYAKGGILVDLDSRRVLWAKKPEQSLPIASMTKMMTLLVAIEQLDASPERSFETPVQVTKSATKIGGSQIWLDPRETLTLETLFKAVAIKSANDAAYLISEYFGGGDVASFVARMNERAKELGFSGTRFVNAHGLTDSASGENSVSTPEEMVLLGERLLEYPKLMEWFGTPMDHFTYPVSGKTIELANHNKLVRPRYPGVDGIKTGYNAQSGFCLTVSCLRNGRRLMACVMGFPAAKDLKTGRDPFARKLLDWGYSRAAELDRSATAPRPTPTTPTSQSPTRNLRR